MIVSSSHKTKDATRPSKNNCCDAALSVISYGSQISHGTRGEYEGCVFKVGDDMYFVPTQRVANRDTLYIACNAQKIEGGVDEW